AQKPVLQLGGTPLLVRPRPGARNQPLRPRDRPGIEGAIRQLVAELVGLVGNDQHIIADALSKTSDFGLDREMAGIGQPPPRDEGPRLLLDATRLKLLRGMANVGREFAVLLAVADDQQNVAPALSDK